MSYDYKTEQFPPALDLGALNDILVYSRAGDWRSDLKPVYHVTGYVFSFFAKPAPAPAPTPTPAPPIVKSESPFEKTYTFDEGLVHAALPISLQEIQAHQESTAEPKTMLGFGLGEILLVYRVLKTLAVDAPALYAAIKAFLGKPSA